MNKKKLRKIRREILKHLDRTGWAWDRAISNLLDQVDNMIQRSNESAD